MALREWRCRHCDTVQYLFEGEEDKRFKFGGSCPSTRVNHVFFMMPPNPTVIHTTDTWMSEPHLDSFETVYELDRQLNIEASIDRETKLMQEARKNS